MKRVLIFSVVAGCSVVTEYHEASAVFNQWMRLSMFARYTAERQCEYPHWYAADLSQKI